MERKALVACYRAVGLVVGADGVVQSGGRVYGCIGTTDFETPEGDTYPIEHIMQVQLDDGTRVVQMDMDDGGFVMLPGVRKADASFDVDLPRPMPRTVAELNAVFEELFPGVDSCVYYDELVERDMIDMAMLDRPKEGFKPLSDKLVALYHESVEKRLKNLHFEGRPPAREVMDEVLTIRTYGHNRNAFREWVESHPWDGKPRVRMWFRNLFGATAPPLKDPEEELRYLGDVSEAWFVGAVRRQYRQTRHEIVPVLISDQGIGKGLALRYTAGQDAWFKDTAADVSDVDKFLNTVRGKIVVELSESKQIRTKDAETLKSFISQDTDKLRKAYAHYDEEYPRHFVLVATSNLENIFTDVTGNRRYFPMICDPHRANLMFSEDRTVGQEEVEQVWAEALVMYRTKHTWFMSPESAAIAEKVQSFYTVENTGVSLISEWLDTHIEYSKVGARINRTKIMRECFGVDTDRLVSSDMESAYRAWVNGDPAWMRINTSARIDGKPSRGFERRLAPGEVRATARLNVVPGGTAKPTPLMIMRQVCMREGCTEPNDIFPHQMVDEDTLNELMNEGWIYSPSIGEYRVGELP